MTELRKLTIIEALKGLNKKDFSSLELVQAHLKHAKERNQQINAYVEITEEKAIEQAKIADRKYELGENGLLQGIPLAVKDLFCTKGIRTTACSNILNDFVPPYESTVTKNLFNAGGVMIGKANMDDNAMGSSNQTSCYGEVVGPWKNAKGEYVVPGGSSGGSAAAVCDYQAMGALGSDTGGSVRQPAAFTGLVGVKPSYGRCSRWGMMPFASSLDQAGVLTRTVDDAAILLQAIMSDDDKDSTIAKEPIPDLLSNLNIDNLKGMKIGIPKEYMVDDLPREIYDSWHKGMKYLEEAGALVEEVSLPHTKYGLSAYYIIAPAEASSNLSRYDGVRYGLRVREGESLDDMYEATRSLGFGKEVKRRILIGTYVLSAGQYDAWFLQAQRVRNKICHDFDEVFTKYDALLTPTTISEAFAMKEKLTPVQMYRNDLFTIPASLAGLPCASVPTILSNNNLPLGLQIITKRYDEVNCFKVAKILENNFKFKLPGSF